MKKTLFAQFENLIPLPQLIRPQPGRFTTKKWSIFCNSADIRLQHALDRIFSTGWQRVESPDEATLILLKKEPRSIPKKLSPVIRCESYRLEIALQKVEIHAGTEHGLYYGLQTLAQLTAQSNVIPCGVIVDWPDMELRGVHLTLGSGHMPQFERLQEIIQKLGLFKLNSFHIEYDASFSWEKYPFIAIPSPLTKDQCRHLISVAKENFVELVPTLDSLGHQEHYLRHESLQHLRELPNSNDELCACNPKSKAFIKDLWREVLEVHSDARYVNITGDEVFRMGAFCPKCSEFAKRGKLADLFFNYYDELARWMLKQGKRPMMWHDMLANHPERLPDYPKELMVLYWNYWGTDARQWEVGHGLPEALLPEEVRSIPEKLRKLYEPYWHHCSTAPHFTPWPYLRFFTDQGFETLGASAGSPVVDSGFPFAGFRSRIKNAKSMAQGVKAVQGKGLVHTYWSTSASIETAWADIAAAGDYSWHSREEATDDYLKRFDALFLGSGGKFPAAARRFDEMIYPAVPPGFNICKNIPSVKKEAANLKLWMTARRACRRNPAYLDAISPAFELESARNAVKRYAQEMLQSELGRGKDFPLDLSKVFTGSTRRIIPSMTGTCLDIPTGHHRTQGVELRVDSHEKPNAVILRGGHHPQGPESVVISMKDKTYDRLFFYHTSAWGQEGTEVARYEMEFADGSREVLPIVVNHNIGDWNSGKEVMPAALVAWEGFSNAHDMGRRMLYLAWWKNSLPSRPIRQVTLTTTNTNGYIALIAITGRQLKGRQPTRPFIDGGKVCRQIAAQTKRFETQYRKTYNKLCVPEHIDRALGTLAASQCVIDAGIISKLKPSPCAR